MLRSNGDVLYVGKASSLKQRVNSYFRGKGRHGGHILEMLTQAHSLDTIVTSTALEAALLEVDEIKKENPPYNIALRNLDRGLIYCDWDGSISSAENKTRHPLGPFPEESFTLDIPNLILALRGSLPRTHGSFLGLPIERFAEGALDPAATLVKASLAERGFETDNLRGLFRMGAHLWKMQKTQENTERQEEATPSPREVEWDAQRIVELMEAAMIRISHLWRRARWFSLIRESMISWHSERSAGGLVTLHLSKGRVLDKRIGHNPDPFVSSPVGRRRGSNPSKWSIQEYDRLAVLTTEVKRLQGAGSVVAIQLTPNLRIGGERLSRILFWL
jgi:DNA polymerase-3 subunit epsilon